MPFIPCHFYLLITIEVDLHLAKGY